MSPRVVIGDRALNAALALPALVPVPPLASETGVLITAAEPRPRLVRAVLALARSDRLFASCR